MSTLHKIARPAAAGVTVIDHAAFRSAASKRSSTTPKRARGGSLTNFPAADQWEKIGAARNRAGGANAGEVFAVPESCASSPRDCLLNLTAGKCGKILHGRAQPARSGASVRGKLELTDV